jgi:hypothetical protein
MELSSQEFTVQGLTSLVNPTPSSFFQINTGTIYSLYSLKGRFLLKTKFKTLHEIKNQMKLHSFPKVIIKYQSNGNTQFQIIDSFTIN